MTGTNLMRKYQTGHINDDEPCLLCWLFVAVAAALVAGIVVGIGTR